MHATMDKNMTVYQATRANFPDYLFLAEHFVLGNKFNIDEGFIRAHMCPYCHEQCTKDAATRTVCAHNSMTRQERTNREIHEYNSKLSTPIVKRTGQQKLVTYG